MGKVFSFASWNVEHFRNNPERIDRAVEFLANADPSCGEAPDVFAIYEVEGSQVFAEIMRQMPTHSFFITEAEISQNILVGIRHGLNGFVTQREKLKSGVPSLRPGALATIQKEGVLYSILFLHLKADDRPRSWGLRDDMTLSIRSLKRKLDDLADTEEGANFLVMGDFNNVGMDLAYSNKDFSGDEELARYNSRFSSRKLRLLSKTADLTFSNGSTSATEPADLDHVYASRHLNFHRFENDAEVLVRGWPEFDTVAEQDAFIADYSDHALLYGEVHD